MSIGADWRQLSPGNGASIASGAAGGKSAGSNAAEQLVDGEQEGRGFSEYVFGDDGIEFTDFLDVINPLQHIPGVGMIYRSITGDELGNGARVVGGGLFGGIFGLAGAAIDAVVDLATGEDTGSHIMAMFEDDEAPADQPVMADASEADAGSNGAGDLVLPWTVGDTSMAGGTGMPVDPAEQATITDAAPVTGVEMLTMNGPSGAGATAPISTRMTSYNAADLVTPWGVSPDANTTNTGVTAANAQSVAQPVSPQQASPPADDDTAMQAAERLLAQAGDDVAGTNINAQDADPAELAVAIARAGQTDIASNMTMRAAEASRNGHQATIQRASFNSDDGNTVWSRAQNSGRLSRGPSQFAVSPEVAAHEAKYAKGNQDDVTKPAATQKPGTDQSAQRQGQQGSQGPLSAAEMAARFNAALGHDRAQMMANDAVASSNTVAQDKPAASNQVSRNDGAKAREVSRNESADEAEAVHPLMEQAESHNDAPVGAWFSQTMMDGLKKYQAMQQNRQPEGNSI